MIFRTFTIPSAAAMAFLLPGSALAENTRTIDDFTQGLFASKPYASGGNVTFNQNGDPAHILGGNRDETLFACYTSSDCAAWNPYNQYSSFAIGTYTPPAPASPIHALVQTTGYYEGMRLEDGYGYIIPMQANFNGFDRIRLNFTGLTAGLNFNILAFTGSAYGQNGCNIASYAGAFSVEVPLTKFRQPGSPINWGNINAIDFVFQSGSAIGGTSFGIKSIVLSDTAQAGAIPCSF